MTAGDADQANSLEAIIWNNWGIVDVLAQRREQLKSALNEALFNAMSDEEAPSAAEPRSIIGDVRPRANGRGVETKYSMFWRPEGDESENTEDEQVSLGAVTVDFPSARDGGLSLEVSATLPQQRIFGYSLEASKRHIRTKVDDAAKRLTAETVMVDGNSDQEIVNIHDLERATGRNDIAKRVVEATAFTDAESVADNIEEYVQQVMGIYKIYTRIPLWLSELGRFSPAGQSLA
mgnify:CR=1 FL=1